MFCSKISLGSETALLPLNRWSISRAFLWALLFGVYIRAPDFGKVPTDLNAPGFRAPRAKRVPERSLTKTVEEDVPHPAIRYKPTTLFARRFLKQTLRKMKHGVL